MLSFPEAGGGLRSAGGTGCQVPNRISAKESQERDLAKLLPRPAGRPSQKPLIGYMGFVYQDASWKLARRVVPKVEHHAGELFPRVEFIVTNMSLPSRAMVCSYSKRPTAERWIMEGSRR